MVERGQNAIRCERVFLEPHARGVEKSVRNRGSRGPDHLFAGAVRFLVHPLNDNRGHFGTLLKPKDGISVPVETRDVRLRERHFFLEHAAGGLHQHAGDLVFNESRIDRKAYVERSLLVSDDDIRAAQRALWDKLRVVTEPGGAAAFAALLSGKYAPAPGERVAALLCGANTSAVRFE